MGRAKDGIIDLCISDGKKIEVREGHRHEMTQRNYGREESRAVFFLWGGILKIAVLKLSREAKLFFMFCLQSVCAGRELMINYTLGTANRETKGK